MNTKKKYPQSPLMDNRKRQDWQRNKDRIYLIGGSITVALVVYLIIKFNWIRWVYVALSIVSIVVFGVYKLFVKVPNAQISHSESSRAAELESLKILNQSLNGKVEELNGTIKDKNAEIARLNQLLEDIILQYRLENKYSDVMRFLQKLNKYIDDEKIDREFAANIREYISSVLNTYGYRILDYSPEISYAYEEEICSVPSPELVRRAIIDNKGNVVLKGKIYLNSNGQ